MDHPNIVKIYDSFEEKIDAKDSRFKSEILINNLMN